MKLIDPVTGQAVWDSNDPNAGPVTPAPEGRQWVRVDEPGDTMAPRLRAPGILDIGNGVTERLAFLNKTFNPVEGIGSAMRAGSRMMAPDQSYWDRIASLGDMLSGVAGVAAPIAAAKAIGVPAASAMMEGLLGWSPTQQAAGDTMRAVGRDVVDRLNQRGPMPTTYSNPIPGLLGGADEAGSLPGMGRGRPSLDVSRRDASNIFGEGSERVRYTDPQSGGTIEVVVRPDGSASVLELEVPEASRGQGIGQTLQERVMQDFPVMGGQVSSKAAATTAYRLGRRPPGKPNATLEEVFADIDEMSSVNMVSPAMQKRIAPSAPSLPAPRNEAEAMARDILQLRAEGRADEVTDEMRAAADPQYMFYNTPLPMDYASRMARAAESHRTDLYSGTGDDFQAFDDRAVYASTNPDLAYTYAPSDGGMILPLAMRAKHGAPMVDAGGANWNKLNPSMRVGGDNALPIPDDIVPRDAKRFDEWPMATRDYEEAAKRAGFSGVTFNDIVDVGGYFSKARPKVGTPEYDAHMDYLHSATKPTTVEARFYPNQVRSRFALFDPEFSHLRNLSAGVGGAAVLTALGDDAEAGTPETQIMDLVKQSGVSGAAQILGVSRRDIEEAISIAVPPSQWDQLVVGPQ